MATTTLSVREMNLSDVPLVIDYWLNSDPNHLVGMGDDLSKVPTAPDLEKNLVQQIKMPIGQKKSYALIWLINGKAAGHCNVNTIKYGHSAYMHLHLWDAVNRRSGFGAILVKRSLPFFFNALNLNYLFCEPYANNAGPNAVLKSVGFKFEKSHVTIPGSINFKQKVNRWIFTREDLS